MLELLMSDCDAKPETIGKYLQYASHIDRVCLPCSLITEFKALNNTAEISALIDFPYGLSSSKAKLYEVIQAYRNGATSVDLFINRMAIVNKKYNAIYDELSATYAVAHERRMDFRVVIESRTLEPAEIDKIAELALVVGIPGLILASGTSPIDLSDQLIIAKQIMKKTSLQVHVGPIWNVDQYNTAARTDVFGIRFNSIHALEAILKPRKGV